ncbi:hypothetical protein CLAIMM_11744 [Cladophialophora immunda]|nr:hypothetical protein CLAIMM_11744 [Cladophialophora immunda]
MVFCTYCGREFSRDEHLQRHILIRELRILFVHGTARQSHHSRVMLRIDTNTRPFKCAACHMTFNRKDVAQKHYNVHTRGTISGQVSTATDNGSAPVPTLSTACASCSKNKTKCDRQISCGRCRSKGIVCVPRPPLRAQRPTSSNTIDLNPLRPGSSDSLTNNPAAVIQGEAYPSDVSIFDQNTAARADSSASDARDSEPERTDDSAQHHGATSTMARPDSQHCEEDAGPIMEVPIESYVEDQLLDSSNLLEPTNMDGEVNWADLFLSSLDQLRPVPSPYNWPETLGDLGTPWPDCDPFQENPLGPSIARPTSKDQQIPEPYQNRSAQGEVDFLSFNAAVLGKLPSIDEFGFPSPRDSDWNKFLVSRVSSPNVQSTLTNQGAFRRSRLAEDENVLIRPGENIACLGENFADTSPWSHTVDAWRNQNFSVQENFANIPFSETTRERMSGIAQSFFALALDTLSLKAKSGSRFFLNLRKHSSSRILLLPPNSILQKYLETYLTNFEPYYPLISERKLDPNTIINNDQEEIAVILLLLIIAYGSMRDSALKARRLSLGLLETCTLALVKLLDKDSATPRSALTVHCSIQCIYQTAFSGDKYLMNSTLGHIHMYLCNARNSRIFARPPSDDMKFLDAQGDHERAWKAWMRREYMSRLAYSCIMIDQEINLTYDGNLSLAIHELERPMPESDDLWLANDPDSWWQLYKRRHDSHPGTDKSAQPRQHSLRELFKSLLEDKIDHWQNPVSILHMRLLLYPIQILISQLCELFLCLPAESVKRPAARPCRISTKLRLEEIRLLLRTWNKSFRRLVPNGTRECSLKNLTAIIYHFLNLNLAVSFVHLERSAQMQDGCTFLKRDGSYDSWIRFPQEAIFHCGQILRTIRETPHELRPLWWPGAVYRVAIVLWAISVTRMANKATAVSEHIPELIIDTVPQDDVAWQLFIKYDRGSPRITARKESSISLNDSNGIFEECIALLRADPALTPYGAGFALKLERLLVTRSSLGWAAPQ